MILRRLSANLKIQNWTAIAIEFLIVVVGVFIGIQAANWNQARQQRSDTRLLLKQLQVELGAFTDLLDGIDDYYATTRRFAKTAEHGWRRDPRVSDREFVIAAYQASQVTAASNNAAIWAQIFSAQELRHIADLEIRTKLAGVLTFDNSLVNLAAVATPYREQVRKVIPDDIQNAIRERCGDRLVPGPAPTFALPSKCDIPVPEAEMKAAADSLRAQPQLQAELRWHQAAVANQLLNVNALKNQTRELTNRLAKS
jgi:uncharacterized membrane-anchored protein YhcB (DUF1043 family)